MGEDGRALVSSWRHQTGDRRRFDVARIANARFAIEKTGRNSFICSQQHSADHFKTTGRFQRARPKNSDQERPASAAAGCSRSKRSRKTANDPVAERDVVLPLQRVQSSRGTCKYETAPLSHT